MKKALQWFFAIVLVLIGLTAVSQSVIGGVFLLLAAALLAPPIWQEISQKTGFAYRNMAIAGLLVIGMPLWMSSEGFLKEAAANRAKKEAAGRADENKAAASTSSETSNSSEQKPPSNSKQQPGKEASPAQSAPPISDADRRANLLHYQVESKERLLANLRDPDSAKFENVYLYTTVHDGKKAYAFCGTVNAKNGMGGYAGAEEFIAAPTIAATRSQMADFPKAWKLLCSGKGEKLYYF